ncbi:erythromycin esterase family protein [Streptomyces sp. NPDC060194]|uniref:erythromycin esterase family protein n=1 Tax=Streptomyces sp. NPDC060194 TaxID=3347069 RepID=UPI00365BCA7F
MATDIAHTVHPVEAAAVLRLFPAPPRLLALGEPTHGEDALLAVRNDLFRQLVEQQGYRTIALESDCLKALVVDDYVTSGAGGLDEVMERGFAHGWGEHEGNRELVSWMREFNAQAEAEGRGEGERVRFAGFDGPLEFTGAASPREAVLALHDWLASRVDAQLMPCERSLLDTLLGADGPWSDPAAMTEPERSRGRSTEALELRLIVDELTAVLETCAPHLSSAPEELHRARLHARTATGLLRYHHAMADPSPARMTRLVALRDLMMADTVRALRGPALLYGHNGHLQRVRSTMRLWQGEVEWWGAGALVAAHGSGEYGFVATALGTLRHRGVDAPPPDTVEGLLHAQPRDHGVVDVPALLAALDGTRPVRRESPWFGYAPLDPAGLHAVDGLVYVRDVGGR